MTPATPPGISCHDIGLAHVAVLEALHRTAFAEPWDQRALAGLLSGPGVAGVLAVDAGPATQPLGFILCRAAADEAEVLTIAVHPDARRRGVGRALMGACGRRLAGLGVERLFLEVAAGNGAARALYAACGFAQVGRRKNYYARPDGPEDALVLAVDVAALVAT